MVWYIAFSLRTIVVQAVTFSETLSSSERRVWFVVDKTYKRKKESDVIASFKSSVLHCSGPQYGMSLPTENHDAYQQSRQWCIRYRPSSQKSF